MAGISLSNIVKKYGDLQTVHGIDLDIKDKEFVVLVGPSGCGKSTTLRMIAGLEEVTSGDLHIGDRKVNDLAPKDRNVAMVFQNYALYPHMNVFDNMAFSLKLRKMAPEEITKRVQEAAKILGLEELLERRPGEMSGGQRQRVAMGRAIVRNPEVFLFDEPLSNLDAKLRNQMRAEIKKLHQQMQTTVVYVTHDQVEAMTLADRIVVLRDGIIEQVGTPQELFDSPANIFVGQFIGNPPMNLFNGDLQKDGSDYFVSLHGKKLPVVRKLTSSPDTREVKIGFRSENIHIATKEDEYHYPATIKVVEFLGSETIIHVEFEGGDLLVSTSERRNFKEGDSLEIAFDMEKIHLFDASTEKAIR